MNRTALDGLFAVETEGWRPILWSTSSAGRPNEDDAQTKMTLLNVEYEFFDYEEASSDALALDRQIRLQFADSPALYVSWTWERQRGPDDQCYSIAYSPSSYFTEIAARVIDASNSPFWSSHIGREIELAYVPSQSRDFEYQVLEVRSGTDRTYVYSLGTDRVEISHTSPLEGRFAAS